jgi:hypothetical protein
VKHVKHTFGATTAGKGDLATGGRVVGLNPGREREHWVFGCNRKNILVYHRTLQRIKSWMEKAQKHTCVTTAADLASKGRFFGYE